MNLRFRITFKQQLLVLIPFLAVNITLTIGFMYLFAGMKVDTLLLCFFLVVFGINILPVVILHIQYLIFNLGANLEINADKGMFIYNGKGRYIECNMSEIKELKYFASSGHISQKGSSEYYTFDPYRYYKIILKDGQEIVVTCLMMNDIEDNLEKLLNVKAERFFRVIAFITRK